MSLLHTTPKCWVESSGLRPSKQRVALAELLMGDGQHRHITAEELFAKAKSAGEPVALATVYNTLRAFCDAGLLREITVDGSRSYFDTNTSQHPHFYWEDSGHLSDAPAHSIDLRALPDAPEGTEISAVDVIVRLRQTR